MNFEVHWAINHGYEDEDLRKDSLSLSPLFFSHSFTPQFFSVVLFTLLTADFKK